MPGPVAFDTPWSTDARGLTTLRRLSAITTGLCALAAAFAAPASAAPVPIVDCITPSGTDPNLRWIYFGYVNTGQQQFIDFGDANQVAPGLGYQGQPTVFNPGSYPRVFRAIYNVSGYPDGVGWTVGGTTAQATLASPRCQAGATGPVSALTPTGATLHGLVEADGAQTAHYFNYGTTIAYGQSTLERQTSSASGVLVSEPITGLLPNTTYHYRLVASSGTITTVGEDRTFTTPALPPAVEQPPAPVVPAAPEPVTVFVPGATIPVPVPAAAAAPTAADLVLMRSGPRARVRVGRTQTIRLRVSNRGPATATKAGLVARLGDGLRLVSVRGPAGRCWGRATVRCPLGTIAAGRRVTVTLRVRATRPGRLTDTVTVTAAQPEARVADNVVTGSIRARRALRRR